MRTAPIDAMVLIREKEKLKLAEVVKVELVAYIQAIYQLKQLMLREPRQTLFVT